MKQNKISLIIMSLMLLLTFLSGCKYFTSNVENYLLQKPVSSEPDDIILYIYPDGKAIIEESRTIEIDEISTIISLSGIPSDIDYSSLTSSIKDENGNEISIKFHELIKKREPTIESLNAYIGMEIQVGPETGKEVDGILLEVGEIVSVMDEDDNIRMLPWEKISYIKIKGGDPYPQNQARLIFHLNAETEGTLNVFLKYAYEGISWDISYSGSKPSDSGNLVLSPIIEISNNTPISYKNAELSCNLIQENKEETTIYKGTVNMSEHSKLLIKPVSSISLENITDTYEQEIIDEYLTLYRTDCGFSGMFQNADSNQVIYPERIHFENSLNSEDKISGTLEPFQPDIFILFTEN